MCSVEPIHNRSHSALFLVTYIATLTDLAIQVVGVESLVAPFLYLAYVIGDKLTEISVSVHKTAKFLRSGYRNISQTFDSHPSGPTRFHRKK